MKLVSPSALRADIYRLLDEVVATGEPLEVDRAGTRLRIVVAAAAADADGRFEALVPIPNLITGDPEDLVHLDWSSEWRP